MKTFCTTLSLIALGIVAFSPVIAGMLVALCVLGIILAVIAAGIKDISDSASAPIKPLFDPAIPLTQLTETQRQQRLEFLRQRQFEDMMTAQWKAGYRNDHHIYPC